MANVSASLAAIQQAFKTCMEVTQDLNSAASKLEERYKQAGQDWRDSKYTQFGGIVEECTKAMKAPLDELQDCASKLNQIEAALSQYGDVNL